MLLTFALGLASVFVFNGSLKYSDEVPIILPQTETGELVVVFPRYKKEMPKAGGGGSGGRDCCAVNNEIKTKVKRIQRLKAK